MVIAVPRRYMEASPISIPIPRVMLEVRSAPGGTALKWSDGPARHSWWPCPRPRLCQIFPSVLSATAPFWPPLVHAPRAGRSTLTVFSPIRQRHRVRAKLGGRVLNRNPSRDTSAPYSLGNLGPHSWLRAPAGIGCDLGHPRTDSARSRLSCAAIFRALAERARPSWPFAPGVLAAFREPGLPPPACSLRHPHCRIRSSAVSAEPGVARHPFDIGRAARARRSTRASFATTVRSAAAESWGLLVPSA